MHNQQKGERQLIENSFLNVGKSTASIQSSYDMKDSRVKIFQADDSVEEPLKNPMYDI